MPDPQDLQGMIDGFGIAPADKDRTWNAYHTATDSGSLQKNIDGLPLTPDQKTVLWNHWHGSHAAGVDPSTYRPPASGILQRAINVDTPFGDLSSGIDWMKSKIPGVVGGLKKVGKSVVAGAQDPHTSLPTIGAVAGATVAGPESFGLAAPAGAATGAALGEAAADVWDLARGRRPSNVVSGVTSAGAGGFAGEMIPMAPRMRPLQSEAGQAVEKLYGKTAMPHQMTESSLLDFLYNIAGGMTGSPRIAAQHEAQRGVEAAGVREIAGKIHPSLGLPSDSSAQHVREVASQTFQRAQKPVQKAYGDWLKNWGGRAEQTLDPITDEMKDGVTVAELHKMRSDALERGRDALADGDAKGAYEANKIADNALGRIQKLVGQAGSSAYDQLGSAYRQVMEKYDNPLMSKLRRGVHPEQLADMLLNPEQSFPKMVPHGARVSQAIPEMMGRVKEALPPQSWQELQAATLQKLYENSIKLSSGNATVGELSAKTMKDQISKMGEGAFQTLFETSAQPIKDFSEAVAAAHRVPGQTGKFFIDLRQAAAVSMVGGAVAGTVLQQGGDKKEASEAGALAAAGTYIIAPWALARIMTNPNLRGLLIRGLEESDPTIKQQIATGLTRLVSQNMTAKAANAGKTPSVDPTLWGNKPQMGDVQIPPAPRTR